MVVARMKSPFSVSKKWKIDVDNYDDLCDPDNMCSHRNEISEYVHLKSDEETDLLQFLRDNKMFFPKLYIIACRVLCVPATEATRERVSSVAGRILEKSQTSLFWLIVYFLHSNMN